MESVTQVKQALSACSRTATLDELRTEGRKKVRLVKAEQVAAMISEAVNRAVEQSGMLSQEQVDELVENSRREFRGALQEREKELQKAQHDSEQLEERNQEVATLRAQLAELQQQLAESGGGAAGGGAGGVGSELLMKMMQEMANLKAQIGSPAAAAAPGADISKALEQIAGSLNDRLDQFGRKIGISSAVDAGNVDFSGLFKDDGKKLESNMDNVQVKQKAGGGIGANLAKLKKLKGGG